MFEVKKTDSDMIAMKKFFGYKDGQSLKEFSEEVKRLTEADKAELGAAIREQCGD
jgi:hypothetical protein